MGAFDEIFRQLANFNGMAVGITEVNCALCLVTCAAALLFRRFRASGPQTHVLALVMVQCVLYGAMHSYWEASVASGVVVVSFLKNTGWSFLEASYFALISIMVCSQCLSDARRKSKELLRRVDTTHQITELFGVADHMPQGSEMNVMRQMLVGLAINFACCVTLAATMFARDIL